MSLDGLRAWIGEVERRLGARTRVFLVLTAIAIGGAAAGVYLGLEAQDSEVSEGDLQTLQSQLEEQIGGGGAADAAAVTKLQADLKTLEAEVEELRKGSEPSPQAKGKKQSEGAEGEKSGGSTGTSKGTSSGGKGAEESGEEAAGTVPQSGGEVAGKLRELVEQAKQEAEEAK
jgi:TolA-binding protein